MGLTVLLIISALGCAKTADPEAAPEPGAHDTVAETLEQGARGADLAQHAALVSGSYETCLAAGVMASALRSAAEAVSGAGTAAVGGDAVIPGISVDVSGCMELGETWEEGEEVSSVALAVVDGLLFVADLALDAYLHAAGDGESCAALAWMEAGVEYARGTVGPVASQLTTPTGAVEIPGVSVTLEECD